MSITFKKNKLKTRKFCEIYHDLLITNNFYVKIIHIALNFIENVIRVVMRESSIRMVSIFAMPCKSNVVYRPSALSESPRKCWLSYWRLLGRVRTPRRFAWFICANRRDVTGPTIRLTANHICHRDLANNHIASLDGSLFRNLSHLHDLLLGNNYITSVPRDAFRGLVQLKVL